MSIENHVIMVNLYSTPNVTSVLCCTNSLGTAFEFKRLLFPLAILKSDGEKCWLHTLNPRIDLREIEIEIEIRSLDEGR